MSDREKSNILLVLQTKQKKMTEEEYLKLAKSKYASLKELGGLDNFYDYEKTFDKIWRDLGKEVLEKNLSELGKDRRKKKR